MTAAELRRVPLDLDVAPEWAALLVRDDPRPFALVGDWAGGGALVGSAPVRVAHEDEDPFALLDDLPVVSGAVDGGAAVGGGWFGYLGHAIGGAGPPRVVPLPAVALAYYDHLLRLDGDGRWWFEALWTPERAQALDERLAMLRTRTAEPRPFSTRPWVPVPGWRGHASAVAAARERIHAGDLFQANLSVRLESELDGDAVDLFTAGVAALRPARSAWVAGPWGAVASLSPELFLRRRGREVLTAPIKGTRPSHDPGAAAELASSEKDRAENVMIVDLMRNDLGRVCEPGSIHVAALHDVRPHAGVWHMVSEVAGTLRAGAGDGDLLRATFPPGSVTGAPKLAALDVIAELESTAREAYTGAIGFASPVAGLELSVAIRTFECAGQRIWLGVGGGVVADSDPAAEAEECRTKAAPLLAAIGAEMAPDAAAGPAPAPVRLGPRPLPRPDPSRGVFATVLAEDGRAVAAAVHLAHLERSVRALFGAGLPGDAAARLDRAALDGPGRLRVAARPSADGVELTIERGPLPVPAGPTALRTFAVPGGLGPHKWLDRRGLDALAAAADGALPLLVDLDGLVLEASRANVVIAEGDRLLTPPADGRIWAGTTRARLLAGRAIEEAPIPLDRLLRADAVLLTGALRGVEAAGSCDGVLLPAAAALAATIRP